ncbi:MAG TPA: hypothetical protein VJB99_02015 [Patescibacteria group bacterium]|nr:hypothetical protein [Patescibacteria group bacterium]
MRSLALGLAIMGIFLLTEATGASMTSSSYRIEWDALSQGGGEQSASSSYKIRDTVGEVSPGIGESSSYQLAAGYRAGVYDPMITFDLFVQQTGTERVVTTLSERTVTTSTDGFSVGDMIAVVQDKGESQISAFGKIISLGAGTLTVDAWKNAGVTPVVDGTDDVVYRLSSNAIDLETLRTSAVRTALVGFEVSSDIGNGYVVNVLEDGELRAASDFIDDVSDGSVTVGQEEYGARSSDSSLSSSTFDSIDSAITSSFQEIATDTQSVLERRNFLTLKAAIASTTPAGTYGQNLSLVVSGNF